MASRRFDEAALLWIDASFPAWFDGPSAPRHRFGPLPGDPTPLVVVTYAFYRKGAKITATLLPVATLGSMILTEVLRGSFSAPVRSSSTPATTPPVTLSRAATPPLPGFTAPWPCSSPGASKASGAGRWSWPVSPSFSSSALAACTSVLTTRRTSLPVSSQLPSG